MAIQLPISEQVVVRDLLERNAAAAPDATLVRFEDGSSWTRAQALHAAYHSGQQLRRRGVRRGDAVAVFLPNGPDFLRAWWGLCMIGAVVVPVNLAFRHGMLEHLIRTSGATAAVVGDDLVERLDELGEPACRDLQRLDPSTLRGATTTPPLLDRPIAPWDIHILSMTSGTTGPSKLSRTTYWHTCLGQDYLTRWHFGPDDVYLIDIPLFHAGGLYSVMLTLAEGAQFVVRSHPALSTYWETARDLGATTAVLVSSMVSYLMAQPPNPAERQHRLRRVLSIPLPADPEAFMNRFGITDLATGYGSTEVPACIVAPAGPAAALAATGSCGQVREGFDVRLVDEHDIEVPVGEVGEAIVRTDQPWMISQGYQNDHPATVESWRNGWFHTGDLLRRDEFGNFFFVDRNTDSLRRRGENISSFEVEAEVNAFPGVVEAACVAVRDGEQFDDEVKVWVVTSPGATVEPEALFHHCVARLPHFMVPRYLEFVDQLPKTPTAKVRKFELRQWGNGARTWDRNAHGLRLTRVGLAAD